MIAVPWNFGECAVDRGRLRGGADRAVHAVGKEATHRGRARVQIHDLENLTRRAAVGEAVLVQRHDVRRQRVAAAGRSDIGGRTT